MDSVDRNYKVMWNLNRIESILQVIAFTASVIGLSICFVRLSMLLPMLYAIPVAIFLVSVLLIFAIKVIKRSN